MPFCLRKFYGTSAEKTEVQLNSPKFTGPFPCCVRVSAVSTLDFTDRTSPCASTKDLERDRGVDKKGIKKGSKQALNKPQDGPQIFTG